MSFAPPKMSQPPKISTLVNTDWTNGVISALDDGRMPLKGLIKASNMMLDQDGTLRPMPSLQKYGVQPSGTIKGRTYRFSIATGYDTKYYKTNLQTVTANEVQDLSISGSPTGGTFTLTYDSQTTDAIDYNASASAIQTALEALSTIGSGNVSCSGGDLPDNTISIEFTGTLAEIEVNTITSTDSLTGGTSPESEIESVIDGGEGTYLHVLRPTETNWSICKGFKFSDDSYGRFSKIVDDKEKVIITNKEDSLAYLDLSTVDDKYPSVVTFTELDDPDAPTLDSNNAPSGTTFSIYYGIYATSTVGTTKVSEPLEISTGKSRDQWKDDGTEYVSIKWTAVPNAISYSVCVSVVKNGEGSINFFTIAAGISGSATTFTDDGSQPQSNALVPTYNSTKGPICESSTVINGRVWLIGDKNSPHTIWFGGTNIGFRLDFSSNDTGGNIKIDGGVPSIVWNFRGGQGDTQIKCLTKETGAYGKRYTLSANQITYNSQSFTLWQATEDYGYTGSSSPDGLIVFENSSYYPSRAGFQTSGTKPQLQNLLSTTSISQTIEPTLSKINWDAMNDCIGLGWEGRLYWALPINSDSNNQIWVQDLRRGGAWMVPLNIPADDLFLDIDDRNFSHIVVVKDNTFYKLSYDTLTNIGGAPFRTSGSSGLIYFADNGQEWVNLQNVKIELLRLKGTITFTVNGFTEDGEFVPLGKESITGSTEVVGYGYDEGGYNRGGFNNFENAPEDIGKRSTTLTIDVNENVQYIQISWNTSSSGIDYNISRFVAEYIPIGIKNLE